MTDIEQVHSLLIYNSFHIIKCEKYAIKFYATLSLSNTKSMSNSLVLKVKYDTK